MSTDVIQAFEVYTVTTATTGFDDNSEDEVEVVNVVARFFDHKDASKLQGKLNATAVDCQYHVRPASYAIHGSVEDHFIYNKEQAIKTALAKLSDEEQKLLLNYYRKKND
jgi:hypothetical protein